MRIDAYTKAILTIIAVMITLIACKTIVNPEHNVNAEGPFAGIQFAGSWNSDPAFFDARTGEVWHYYHARTEDGYYDKRYSVEKLRLVKIGEPLVVEIPAKK